MAPRARFELVSSFQFLDAISSASCKPFAAAAHRKPFANRLMILQLFHRMIDLIFCKEIECIIHFPKDCRELGRAVMDETLIMRDTWKECL